MAPERAAVIRTVVADDQSVVRAGIAAILEAEPDITVVGQAADGQAALRLVHETSPDVAVLDIRMPGLDGVAVAAAVHAGRPATRIIMLTTFGLDEYVYTALRAGACGFLLKDTEPEQLVTAVRTAVTGGALLDAALTRRLVDRFTPAPDPADTARLSGLTARESQVLTLVARGLSNAEIAAELRISAATVKDHVAAVLAKLRVRDRVQATIAAYEGGLVRPGTG
ncbi:response regulator [Actinoplanes sp. NPDC004185]